MSMATVIANHETALEYYPTDQLCKYIEDNQDIANQKFWHGQTALHKVCLRPTDSVECVRQLLKANSDINALNNYGETSLMFAAKRGSIPLCIELLQSGADTTLKDQAGRTIVHHAVMGGSIHCVHFLQQLTSCTLNEIDNRKQTCLHMAASQGNDIMVKYLLRYGRCEANKADVYGNTALHYAAVHGHERVVHSIILSFGLNILDYKNEKGQQASDMCDGVSYHHEMTRLLLADAQNEYKKGMRFLKTPRALLVWYTLMPLVIFLAGVAVGYLLQLFFEWYFGSLAVAASLCYILYLFSIHSHRIKHYSRLPNPMFAGAFGSGLIGTTIVWIFCLAGQSAYSGYIDILLILSTLSLLFPMFYLYWGLLNEDPGFLPLTHSNNPPKALQTNSEESFCPSCELVTSCCVKHCKLCERCVIQMDHHCLFLNQCIAKYNHKSFVIFISLVNLNIILFLLTSWRHFALLYHDLDLLLIMSKVLTNHILLLWTVVLNSISLVWGINLVRWNIGLVSTGQTYYESLTHPRNVQTHKPTVKERLINVVRFCKGRDPIMHFPQQGVI